MKRAPQVVASGEVVTVRPALLNVKAAAVYLACSAGYLNALRAADVKRLQHGKPLEGPAWLLLRFGVRYALTDLDAYSARTAVACGRMESKRRLVPVPDEAAP